jgi:hypothetical protein
MRMPPFHEGRDDRVAALPGERSGGSLEGEERAAILQREAGAGRHDRRPEPQVDALNQRDDGAVGSMADR